MNKKGDKKGFTLVEVVVTIGIFLVISSVVLANYSDFNQKISLKKTSQDLVLAMRRAQVYALGNREFIAGSGVFPPGYGLYFSGFSLPTDNFTLYADLNKNGAYESATEKVEEFKIRTGDKIVNLCGNKKSIPPGTCSLAKLDIIYYRPNPVVYIMGNGAFPFSDAEIEIQSPEGQKKTIIIWSSGQISIE